MLENNKKDIKAWAKKLKHDEEFSKKYEGLTTVEGILATARKDGYNIKKEELMEFDLDSVAGGAGGLIKGIDVDVDVDASNIRRQITQAIDVTTQKAAITLGENATNTGGITQTVDRTTN